MTLKPLPPTPPEKTSTTTDGLSLDAMWSALRAESRAVVLKTAARALLAEAKAYEKKWCQKPAAADWDKGFARGVEAAAHSVANAIDRGFFDFGEVDE